MCPVVGLIIPTLVTCIVAMWASWDERVSLTM